MTRMGAGALFGCFRGKKTVSGSRVSGGSSSAEGLARAGGGGQASGGVHRFLGACVCRSWKSCDCMLLVGGGWCMGIASKGA